MVNVTIKGTFPEKYFDKKTTVTATPVLTYAGGEIAFDKVQVLQGESVQANNKVISYTGGDFTYTAAVPYKDAMKMSELVLRVKAVRGKKTSILILLNLPMVLLQHQHWLKNMARAIMMKDKYVRIIPETQVADINYLINRSDIRSTELKAEDIALLKEYIKAVSADPNRQLKRAAVSSYASPDGTFDLNEKLSGKQRCRC